MALGDEPVRERLADARTAEEVVSILGKRRLIRYGVGFGLVALLMLGGVIYLVVAVATGRLSAWVLAALPAPLLLAGFCGPIAYGSGYFAMTGQRWPGANRFDRFLGRLSSNL